MAKRSKRRQVQQNKDHAGCMTGFINIFDFRHGRTTRRLLSDKRLVTRNIVASEDLTSEVKLLMSSEEKDVSIENVAESEKSTLDVVRTSVKALMEEEMVSEQDSTKQIDVDEVELFDSACGNNTEKTSKKSFHDNNEIFKTSHYSDLEALMKEILLVYQRRNEQQSDLQEGRNRTFPIVEEKLSAAFEVFMNEKSSDDKTERSKDFIDTFQMLSSNKELFLKLLQDQINANEDQKSKSMEKSKSLENEPCNPKPDVTRKHRNFFRRRSKSQEHIFLKEENASPLHTSKIVILKPNSPDNRLKVEKDIHSERISHFSFMEIKKRLKNAIGKEQTKNSEKTVVEGSSGWSSPNRDHFYTERFAKRTERVSKLRESETKVKENDENGDSSRHISNIYIEAKKHLSEMLSSGDEEVDMMMENLPKTLGKILSFPDFSSMSPGGSPRKDNELGFVDEKMRLSPRGNSLTVNDGQPCMDNSVDLEEQAEVPDEVKVDTCSTMEDTSFEEAIDAEKTIKEEEIEVFDTSCDQCTSPETVNDDHHSVNDEVYNEDTSPKCLRSGSPEEEEFSSPQGSSPSHEIEEPESSSTDKSGRPSPVSVLEPLFSDNEISPASSFSRPVEAGIQPLCIRFEDQEMRSRSCIENEESAYEYIEAVLLASDLNWDEFEKRWLSSTQILDSSLFNEVEIFSSRPTHDQRLLFDSTNEILNEVCDCYLDFFLQLSFIERKIQPVPRGANLINEVWERIELHLKNNYPLSLDNLVKKDLGISRTWMNLSSDSREVVFEIDEMIFEDMIDDTFLSFFSEFIDSEI